MKIKLYAFGKLKTPGLRDAADYYSRLLKPWAPSFEEIELKPLEVADKGQRKVIQQKEGETLLEKLGDARIYLLDEGGKARKTQAWADLVREWEGAGQATIALCVGSSLGFSEDVRSRAHGMLSLGAQTLPHELARVVLLEQLYRAWSVTRGHPYHNEGR